jgi:hypothetical protein
MVATIGHRLTLNRMGKYEHSKIWGKCQ